LTFDVKSKYILISSGQQFSLHCKPICFMRYLAVAVLALLVAGTASSQGRFGIKAGPVFNYINSEGNGGDFSEVNTGATFGFSYSVPASARLTIQPELNYITLSADESLSNSTYNLDYFQIPILFKGTTKKGDFSFYAGPQLSILAKARRETGNTKSDATSEVTETDFSALAGIEYVTPVNITLNARFTQGFSNVIKAEFDTFKSRHQYVTLTVGYLFGKKKAQ
jgi:hypothetical protein